MAEIGLGAGSLHYESKRGIAMLGWRNLKVVPSFGALSGCRIVGHSDRWHKTTDQLAGRNVRYSCAHTRCCLVHSLSEVFAVFVMLSADAFCCGITQFHKHGNMA